VAEILKCRKKLRKARKKRDDGEECNEEEMVELEGLLTSALSKSTVRGVKERLKRFVDWFLEIVDRDYFSVFHHLQGIHFLTTVIFMSLIFI